MSTRHRHDLKGTIMPAGDADAQLAALDARVKKLEALVPPPAPTLPAIPAGAQVLMLERFLTPGLNAAVFNHPSDFHCCGTPGPGNPFHVPVPGGLVAGYGGPVVVAGDGKLVMQAVRDAAGLWQVPIVDTKGKVEFGPGTHIEVMTKMPVGRGLWEAALWLYGAGGKPEIDVNETLANPVGSIATPGYDVTWNLAHVHWKPAVVGAADQWAAKVQLPSKAPLSDDFHVYGCDWHADRIVFYLDGVAYATFNPADKTQIPTGPLYALLNLGVSNGKDWGGNLSADASTPSPATQVTKYVAAWKIPA